MPLEQLLELAHSGELAPEDAVRRKTGEWVSAGEVRGLFPPADVPPADVPHGAPAADVNPGPAATAPAEAS